VSLNKDSVVTEKLLLTCVYGFNIV